MKDSAIYFSKVDQLYYYFLIINYFDSTTAIIKIWIAFWLNFFENLLSFDVLSGGCEVVSAVVLSK